MLEVACVVDLSGLAAFVRGARVARGWTVPDVRKHGGPSVGWLGALEAGTMIDAPKPATLQRLARALGVEFDVLMELAGYGSGHVSSSQEPANHGPAMVSGFAAGNETRKPGPGHGYKQAAEGIPSEVGHHGEPTLLVPVYGPVACGEPFMWSSGEAIGYERLSAEDAKLIDVVIVVAGDSLSAERINDGDRLGVQRLNGEQPPDGAIVVVEAEGSYMAKVYRRNAVGEYLESRRLGRDPEPLLLGDEVRLVGRARKHIRNL